MNASPEITLPGQQLSGILRRSARRRITRWCWLASLALMLIVPVLSLTACAWPQKQPCDPLPPVSMPALSQPLPPQNYSISVGQSIKHWANELIGTPTTSKP